MTKLQQFMVFINYFSLGLLVPVLNLILLERGANLETLPLLYAVYAITVFCFELPSGICADLYGRKAVFMVSCGFNCLSFLFLVFANHFVWLLFALIFNGLGRAFSSGSLDALIIDQAIVKHGEDILSKVTSRLSIMEGGGLAIGGIMGGVIASIFGTYQVNVIARIVFMLILGGLCWIFIKESIEVGANAKQQKVINKEFEVLQNEVASEKLREVLVENVCEVNSDKTREVLAEDECEVVDEKLSEELKEVPSEVPSVKLCKETKNIKRTPLMVHLREGMQVVLSKPNFSYLILGFFFVGFLINTVETYWQTAFLDITKTQNSTWVLGIISFLGFFAVTIGNVISQKIIDKSNSHWWKIYHVCRILFGSCMIVFGMQQSIIGFILLYSGVYMILGASTVVENTLINKMTPNHMRASVLSLNSFLMQVGTFCASLVSSILIHKVQIMGIWIIAGVLLGVYGIVVAFATRKVRKKEIEVSI
jgi:MFS family permease